MSQFPTVDPKLLRHNPWNTNVVSPDNEAKLDESVERLGMFKPIIVRELPDGTLEILGGAHRRDAAIRKKLASVPIMNLGRISDQRAKEISLVDNGRYGADDTLRLAELLDGLGNPDELSKFMPYTDADFASIFSSVSIALDELDIPDDDEPATHLPTEKKVQTHQIMRFKVPVEDVGRVTDVIERIMKTQRFTEEDSLTNAGNALVHLCTRGA
ncbi:chromosome partitioning protein ParB [Ralstonia pickettii]|uniref:Chromosome partitioning protein ParB n=1 Tax=Ralstonia pickettii TaxID=329 RepID=A0A2N4TXX4_RALPI|nr:ParB N-terminal domain-containing protein [Ralstonia pickettii]PLC44545.1 chromosome partitioning protein ParB [Ralstonia pickettii]